MPDVQIRVFGSPQAYGPYDAQDEPKVIEVIRENVLPQTNEEYFRVDVKIKRNKDQTPAYLIAYLLRKDVYTAEVVRVDVNSSYGVSDVTFNYNEAADEGDEEEEQRWEEQSDDAINEQEENLFEESEDDYAFDIVAATPCPEIPTAKAAVEKICQLATGAGMKCKKLLGNAATIANYKNYLASGVRGFVNIGHGNTNGIALDDGFLPWTWFQSLPANELRPAVVYFNSCQVFNLPLKDAVMKAGARTFIGGIVNLLIGPSEDVCTCFWGKVLVPNTDMKVSLTQCEKDKYPQVGAHGIMGDIGPFLVEKFKLSQAMWTHGHEAQIEYPERFSFMRRYGPFIRLKGKPGTYNWLHFQIPTPVIVDERRLRAGSVMIRFRTRPGAYVHAVHVWDGETKIANHNNLNLASNAFVWPRFDVPKNPYVKWGIGVSIGVKFSSSPTLPLYMDISSVGCDFLTKLPAFEAPEVDAPQEEVLEPAI